MKNSSTFSIFLCINITLLLVMTSLQAFAEDNANVLKLLQDPAEQQLVLDTAKHSPVVLKNPCANANFTLVDEFTVYTPLEFNSSGKIIAGAWKQTVLQKGCGQNRLLNVLLFPGTHKTDLKALPLLPGNTHADPVLQNDAMMYAVIATSRPKEKECDDIYVVDTKFLSEIGEPLEGVKDKPWNELWTLGICKKKAQVTMHFIPDKTGTTINASLEETKFLP